MSSPSLESLIDLAHRAADFWSAQGYEEYLGSVTIDCGLQPRKFRDVADPWQWDRSLEILPALEQLAGVPGKPPYTGPLNFWWEFSKGHDKTTSTAREMNWLLAYSRRPLVMYACGGDRDQAALIRLAMEKELELNPWLKERVEVTGYHAKGIQNGSTLEILAADAATAQGKFPDYIAIEELTTWRYDSGRAFWDAMYSSRNKKPHCLVKINSNSGWRGTWQETVKQQAVQSSRWAVRTQPERTILASWMSKAAIDEDRKMLLPAEAKRVLDNSWVSQSDDLDYLTLDDALACVDQKLTEKTTGEYGMPYWFTVDYGGVNDRSALEVAHVVPGTDEVIVDRLDCWQGTHANPVEIDIQPNGVRSIEGWIEERAKGFPRVAGIVLDPNQLQALGWRLQRRGFNVIFFEYDGGKNNQRMAQLLQSHVRSKKVRWSSQAGFLPGAKDETFAQEIESLVLRVMPYGYRFDHKSGGHDDRSVCVGMSLIHMVASVPPAGPTTPTLIKTDSVNPISRIQELGVQSSIPIFGLGAGNGNPFGRR